MLKTLFLIAAIAAVSEMDYEDAQMEHDYYCAMVAEGHWPEYRTDVNCNIESDER